MDKRLLDILNDSIARELAATIQYMWQHVMVKGLESPEIAEIFKKTSIVEMKHAEKFAERLDYFNGVPTTIPAKIQVGGDTRKMLQDNLAIEREAIELYKKAIKLCVELDDPVTRLMYEEILTDEEDHEYTFSTILGE
ncbi:MAG: ferritin [Chloroflexi bacterium]|nr:ferritin [Chloroflexota bacterium]